MDIDQVVAIFKNGEDLHPVHLVLQDRNDRQKLFTTAYYPFKGLGLQDNIEISELQTIVPTIDSSTFYAQHSMDISRIKLEIGRGNMHAKALVFAVALLL